MKDRPFGKFRLERAAGVPEDQDIATCGMALAIERARDEDRYRSMDAYPSTENTASNAVCRKLGFTFFGNAGSSSIRRGIRFAASQRLAAGPLTQSRGIVAADSYLQAPGIGNC
ncbi:MAG: GNAT family protein [Thermomicrobiales bacterium]